MKTDNTRVGAVVRCPENGTYKKKEYLRETLEWAEKIRSLTRQDWNEIMKISDEPEKQQLYLEALLTAFELSDKEIYLQEIKETTENLEVYIEKIMNVVKMKIKAEKIYSATELAKLVDPENEKENGFEWSEEDFFEALKAK